MSLEIDGIEGGLAITDENSDSGIYLLQGTAAPGGDASFQDAAPVGSKYFERTNARTYRKFAAGTGTDKWEIEPIIDDLNNFSLRGCLLAATGEALSAGVRDLTATPFTDDDAPLLTAADFTVGDLVVGGVGGTPTLFEVTAVASPNITLAAATPALVSGNLFIAKNYLPDSPGVQEGSALIAYLGTEIAKLGDINWNFADGIAMAASFTPVNGIVTSADTVNSAIEKLVGNQDDLVTLSGIAQGSINYGTSFTGSTIPDNANILTALQALESGLEAGLPVRVEQTITSGGGAANIDCPLVDNFLAAQWEVYAQEVGTQNTRILEVEAFHNGNATNDATSRKRSVRDKKLIGSGFNFEVDVILNGSGAAQQMCLEVQTSVVGGVRVVAVRKAISNT